MVTYGYKTTYDYRHILLFICFVVSEYRCSEKFRNVHRKTPVLESLFNFLVTLLKREPNTGIFLYIEKFLRTAQSLTHFCPALLFYIP